MPENRWFLPLIASGLLLSITQNSTAGWDCLPSPDGKWICDGAASTSHESSQPKHPRPLEAGVGQSGVLSQPGRPHTDDTEPTSTPTPTNRLMPTPPSQPANTREIDQDPAQVESGNKVATPTDTDSHADSDPTPSKPVREAAIPVGDRPPIAPGTTPTTAGLESTTAGAASSGTAQAVEETGQLTEKVELQQASHYTSSPADLIPEVAETRIQESAATASVDVDIDRELNWNQCYPWSTPAALSFSPAPAQQMLIDADGSILEQTQDQISLAGNVRVRRMETLLEADSALYRRTAETLDAEGNVYFERPGLRLSAAKAHFDLARNQGEMERVAYRLTDQGAQGNADSAVIESSDLTHFNEIDYTTCKPGQNGWLLHAKELDIDKASGVGTARHAKLSFKGVPFLYLPYASFPIDDRRKSGFLIPTVGKSDRSGVDISAPYYFNIAPNMDATFTPRLMSKRGLLLGGEYRYLQEKHAGRMRAELLPDDQEVEDGQENTRGAFSFQSNGRPAPGWTSDVDLNYVSDNDYLDDLGDSLLVTSARHLERQGQIRYTSSDWSLLGKTQYYQTIDDSISISNRPYSRLPQILFDWYRSRQAYGLTYQLQSEYVNFAHSDEDKTKGQRFDLQPGISLPLNRQWGFLTPKASLKYTHYTLENQIAGAEESPDRLLPTFSLDGGLFFERSENWFGEAIIQTLEPRLFYLYTPYEDQTELPNFDTSDVTFSFASLFRDNRFSGNDKIGDANQLTAALTSRILSDSSGAELLRASIGQIYYFRDREVQLDSTDTTTESSSSLAAELASQIGHWNFRGDIQWDPHKSNNNLERGSVGLRYADSDKRVFNAGYNYSRDSVEQTDLSARWPLGSQWSLVGRWTHSQLFKETILALAGIEYDNCCWRVRLVGQQLLTDINKDPDNAVLLQFQLKGLGGWGSANDSFLENNIVGYRANR